MDIKDIDFLFREVGHISSHYEKMAKITGSNYNIFKVLNLQSSEVRLHSSFLAELLNPKGSHGQESVYLELFLTQFKLTNFDTKSVNVEIEKHLGVIDSEYTQGGRIDIVIHNSKGQNIFIENKIFASDQKNQLLRYHNFNEEAYLFYLNLDGSRPSKESVGELTCPEDFRTISYKLDIIEWLENCKKQSVNLPTIRETITQYISILKKLTNQTEIVNMKEEIKDLLLKNPDYAKSLALCNQVLQTIINETEKIFWDEMMISFPKIVILLRNSIHLEIIFAKDYDGYWFGYSIADGNTKLNDSEKGLIYKKILKEIYNGFYSNRNYIGWFQPKPFKAREKFDLLDKDIIFRLYKDNIFLKEFIQSLIDQELSIRKEFLDRIKQDIPE